MKIGLIGPGIMPIPPTGWGGVEHLIWNFHNQLKKIDDEVVIINTPNQQEIVDTVNSGEFDAVRCTHAEEFGVVWCAHAGELNAVWHVHVGI